MSSASPSWRFSLGLSGLGPIESDQIRALLTFSRTRTQAVWDIGNGSTPDVLLVNGRRAPVPGPGAGAPRLVVHLLEPGEHVPSGEVLHKPLQFDEFTKTLQHLEWTLIGLASVTPAATPAASPAPAVVPHPVPAASVAPADSAHDGTAYHLRRWPPAGVLAADRYFPRLATFLSKRTMTLNEMSRLSGVPAERCRDFMERVRPLGILETLERPAPQRAATPAAPTETTHPAPEKRETHQAHGLIALIRQHLGIGWSN